MLLVSGEHSDLGQVNLHRPTAASARRPLPQNGRGREANLDTSTARTRSSLSVRAALGLAQRTSSQVLPQVRGMGPRLWDQSAAHQGSRRVQPREASAATTIPVA